jgi:methylated-DNA-[protein]-cysteine S-methyltransferase
MTRSDTDALQALIGTLEAPPVTADFVGRALARPFKPAGSRLRYARFLLPVGSLFVAFDEAVVLSQVGGQGLDFEGRIVDLGYDPRPADAPAALRAAVDALVEGGSRFDYPVDTRRLGNFQRRVLDATRTIPRGQVRSYSAVAGQIGAPDAARAVGTALARNPVPILIPCHRVVRTDGVLGEYSGGGSEVKARILRWEGIDVRAQRARFVIV